MNTVLFHAKKYAGIYIWNNVLCYKTKEELLPRIKNDAFLSYYG